MLKQMFQKLPKYNEKTKIPKMQKYIKCVNTENALGATKRASAKYA